MSLNPTNIVPVGITGVIPIMPPKKYSDPFAEVLSIPKVFIGSSTVVMKVDPASGQESYFVPELKLAGDARELTFLVNGQQVKLPVQGMALLEPIVVDTQHPANAALLTGLTSSVKPVVPSYGQ